MCEGEKVLECMRVFVCVRVLVYVGGWVFAIMCAFVRNIFVSVCMYACTCGCSFVAICVRACMYCVCYVCFVCFACAYVYVRV